MLYQFKSYYHDFFPYEELFNHCTVLLIVICFNFVGWLISCIFIISSI